MLFVFIYFLDVTEQLEEYGRMKHENNNNIKTEEYEKLKNDNNELKIKTQNLENILKNERLENVNKNSNYQSDVSQIVFL